MKTPLRHLARWLPWSHHPVRPRPKTPSWMPSELPSIEDDGDDGTPRGCGWFDSSHELRQGLAVSERLDDAAVAAMPLRDWVDWQLQGVLPRPGGHAPATA